MLANLEKMQGSSRGRPSKIGDPVYSEVLCVKLEFIEEEKTLK